MGELSVRFTGMSEAIAALKAWGEREKVATAVATEKAGDFLQERARESFQGSHSPGYPHQGGDRPNVTTGRLQASILPTPVEQVGDGKYTIYVGPTTIYGRIIELGGTIHKEPGYMTWFSPWLGRRVYRHTVSLDGWPFLRPGYQQTVAHMNAIYEDEWTAAIYG